MHKVNYVRALIVACYWWGMLGRGDEIEDESYRTEFDRAIAAFPWRGGDPVSPEMTEAIVEIGRDPGHARKCLADIAGRDYQHSVHVHAFGVGWRDVRSVGVFASGRAERAYRRARGCSVVW